MIYWELVLESRDHVCIYIDSSTVYAVYSELGLSMCKEVDRLVRVEMIIPMYVYIIYIYTS